MEKTPKNLDKKKRRESDSLTQKTNENLRDNLSEEMKLERRKLLDKIEKYMWEIFYATTIFAYNYSTEEDFLRIAEDAWERNEWISNIDKESLEESIWQHFNTENTKLKLSEEQFKDVITRYVNRFYRMREEKKADWSWDDYMQFQGLKYWAKVKKSPRAKKELKEIEKYIDKNA